MMRRGVVTLLVLLAAVPAVAATLAECQQHRHYGRTTQADACYLELTGSSDPSLRAEGFWGLGQYSSANDQFRLAVQGAPENADYRVRWGRMYLDHYQEADAATLFQEALEIDEDHAGAMLGLALVASQSFDMKAVEMASQALKKDPDLLEAQELLAKLALEDVDPERAVKEARKALDISDESLDAMALLATIDWLDDRETQWMDRVLEINPVYGEAYALAGRFFVLNRRYEEGIEHYRRALKLNPRLWAARSELGVNLMRMGREEEAQRELEQCYENGYRDAATVNTLRLIDSYANFETARTDTTVLRLHKSEAELLRPYFQSELDRAIETYRKKYKMELSGPVQVEVYPDHEDFAVRTMGMPGLGALGVTFGHVVAMDSPSGRTPGTFHWASTLWHELSHVYTLEATNHLIPRWFTEGLAVHEETATSPEWGDRISPPVIEAVKEDKLLPIAELDRGFIRPTYPAQVAVSYFQAGKICDYINERWGFDKLLEMVADFRDRKPTVEVIESRLGLAPEAFDGEFRTWLDAQIKTTVESFDDWKKKMKALSALVDMDSPRSVIEAGPAVRDLYPEYVEAGSAYEIIAKAHEDLGDKGAARAELERYMRVGGRNPGTLKHLAELQAESGDKQAAVATLERLNLICPVNDEDLHRRLGDLYFELGDARGSIREYAAVVALAPIDTAASQFNLAKAYRAAKQDNKAFDHVILALEAAPGYRPAQEMLLELSAEKDD